MEKDQETSYDFTYNNGNLKIHTGRIWIMETKQLLGAIVATIAKIAVAAVVIVVVFKLAVGSYEFGYQIFADAPVDTGNGRTVSVTVSEGQGSREIAKILKQKGLIKDANVFYLQEQLSDYKGLIKPGSYELSTAMTGTQMLEIMCGVEEEEEE